MISRVQTWEAEGFIKDLIYSWQFWNIISHIYGFLYLHKIIYLLCLLLMHNGCALVNLQQNYIAFLSAFAL